MGYHPQGEHIPWALEGQICHYGIDGEGVTVGEPNGVAVGPGLDHLCDADLDATPIDDHNRLPEQVLKLVRHGPADNID